MPLLESLKNNMLRELTAAGFNPNDFKWRSDTLIYAVPAFARQNYQFGWTNAATDMYGNMASGCVFSPGDREVSSVERCGESEILGHFKTWVRALKRETSEPDLWKQARELGAVLTTVEKQRQANASADDVPLVGEERKRFLEAVQTVRREVEASNAPEAEKAGMRDTLNKVEEAGGSVNRKWVTQTIVGGVITSVLTLLITKETGLWLLSRLGEAFNAVRLFGEGAVRALGP